VTIAKLPMYLALMVLSAIGCTIAFVVAAVVVSGALAVTISLLFWILSFGGTAGLDAP
jgi:hypothetical protein